MTTIKCNYCCCFYDARFRSNASWPIKCNEQMKFNEKFKHGQHEKIMGITLQVELQVSRVFIESLS